MVGCAVPQHYWPQDDIIGSDAGRIPGQPTVLIASRDSDYKQQLVAELHRRLLEQQISHRIIGVGQLEGEDAGTYTAILIINTCLAWGLDDEVSAFVDRQQNSHRIIVLTTSGEGDWLPDMEGRNFDAISGASVPANVVNVAGNLVARIRQRL